MLGWLKRVALRPIYFAAFVQHFNHFFAALLSRFYAVHRRNLNPLPMQKEV
jgi:hypothetical protein